jgi:RNA polymerase sigma-70 factor (ECF subfamily)
MTPDTRLLRQAQKGDSQAFAELYVALRPLVEGFVGFLDGQTPTQEREDVAQEVFLRVWEGLQAYKGESSAETYLLGLARNVLGEHRRQQQSYMAVLKDLANVLRQSPDSGKGVDAVELARYVRQARAQLSGSHRQAIEWVVVQGLPVAEAARQAGCTVEAFCQRLARAKCRMSQLLAQLQKS